MRAGKSSAAAGILAQQMQRTGTCKRVCGSGTGHNMLAKYARTHSRKKQQL